MTIRKALPGDIDEIADIYSKILEKEPQSTSKTGWIPGVYPSKATALSALERDDLYVCEDGGKILASAIINKAQVDVYAECDWKYKASDDEVLVLHTLTVSPDSAGKGTGKAFISFYEGLAKNTGCKALRIDTNEKNTTARNLYKKLGYREAKIVPCVFNSIPDVHLVLLEKEV